MSRLEILVKEIRGNCVVHAQGDRIVIEGPEIDLEKSDRICIHALAPILHYAVALREGIDPRKLGLAQDGKKAYVHCPDPGKPHTDGGEVIFELELVED
jgi:uncharacterized repeat protein (TIGR04076 family)